ncbi:MAG: DUF2326 domain-containing protein, partial [Ignavibacteria bacterium]|nr:DUF2326 domain-containing protein [Ignavibacteria bacterium]
PEEAQELFAEAGILFHGQIKKDFIQLIEFNKAITDERSKYLEEELVDTEAQLSVINNELNTLGKQRAESLAFLSNTDVFLKYKQVSDEIVVIKSDITSLQRQRDYLYSLQNLRNEIRELNRTITQLQTKVEKDVEEQNINKESQFSKLRLFFSDIIDDVINRKALLSVAPNQEGHLEFKAAILDESGNETSADDGHTYRKLLCIAFDLSILRVHIVEKFPHFVYHDGVFESLDNRKKKNLISVIREYSTYGIQSIITLIDSELPDLRNGEQPMFNEDEIVLTLHDENDQGRLFKMKPW